MLDRLRPHHMARHLTEIDARELQARGVRGVLLDLDNTLTAWGSTLVTPEVAAWMAELERLGLSACVVTNAASTRRVQPVAEHLGIPWVIRAAKPLARGYRRGMAVLGTTPATTAMIGDQVFTDILGGNRLGLYTILVDPLPDMPEALVTRMVQRPLERVFGRLPKGGVMPPRDRARR